MWAKLEGFQFDNNEAVFDFTARLSKENGWMRAFTERVIQEYRRFLLLAVHAGHPVTPSEAVDQAWHLHLVYTRSYWQRMCGEVLGRPLHHEPTAGGLDESAKFRRQYERTVESYRRIFGEEPPRDIWPAVEECFRPKLNRWFDASRHWLVPKPEWLRRLRVAHGVIALLVVFAISLAGCVDLNVFDYRGPDFLLFYVTGFIAAFAASVVLVQMARGRADSHEEGDLPDDPYEIAFLGGGGRRVVDAALAALYSRKVVKTGATASRMGTLGAVERGDDSGLHPVEQRVWRALPLNRTEEVRNVRAAVTPVTERVKQALVDKGMILSGEHMANLRILAALPMVSMMAVGAIKFLVGLDREKPVVFLVICLFVSLIILVVRLAKMNRRSALGEAIWRKLGRRRLEASLARNNSDITSTEVAMAVALAGSSALAIPAYEPLHKTIHRPVFTADSGCGTGGCGGGGGGCGGGGCGGGGCGGCGGGD